MAKGKTSGCGWIVVAAAVLFTLYNCSGDDAGKRANIAADIAADARADATTDAVADLSGTDFESMGDTATCTDDCGGHNAGYAWAMENGITSPGECSGNSQSFIEGCETYGQEIENRANEAAASAESEALANPDLEDEYGY